MNETDNNIAYWTVSFGIEYFVCLKCFNGTASYEYALIYAIYKRDEEENQY